MSRVLLSCKHCGHCVDTDRRFFEGESTNNYDVTLLVTLRSHLVTLTDPLCDCAPKLLFYKIDRLGTENMGLTDLT